jgi:nicotinamide-nucleotide amidase
VGEAVRRSEVVVVTGGLGPTPDDRTREGIALALGLPLAVRGDLLEELRRKYLAYGHTTMPEVNVVQVTLPEGAEAVPNPLGTAPGFRLEPGNAVLFAVPGVPREMRQMLRESIVPWLAAHRPGEAVRSRVLKTMGIGESEMVSRHAVLFAALSERGVDVGFYPRLPGVHLRLTVRGEAGAAAARLAAAEAEVRLALAAHIYGVDEETLPGIVGRELVARGWRVAVAESCTGGALCAALVSAPGASRYVDRGIVAYADRAKIELLGVPAALLETHGAVSEPTARAMAQGLRSRSGVDVAVAVTGIAGPEGGSPGKPVGLVWSAVAAPDGIRAWRSVHPGTRDMIIQRSVMTDLNRLRRVLLQEE